MAKSKGKTSTKSKGGSLGKLPSGVGYRVRSTQTGETKSYKSGKDAAAGAAPIAVENLGTKTTPANIPTLPTPKDPGDLMGMNNEALANTLGDIGLSLDSNKKFVYDPQKSETENAINQSNTTAFQQLMSRLGLQQAPESKTGLYEDTYGVSPEQAQRDYKRQRKEVQNYTGQLNSIVASSQAQQLALEGQGRGQTSSFVGGEQARINREAAIAALPIQAQLATSQANLEEATRHLDNLFKLKSEDADAQYNFKNKLIDAVYDFASQAQQNVLNAKLSDIKDKRAIEQQNLARADEWAKIAMQTGQTGVMAGFAALNPSSPTFQQDFARLQGQVRKPVEIAQPGVYTSTQLKAITKLNEDIAKSATYAKTASMRGYIDNVKGALAQQNGISDIAAINQFQKVIDEGAVTRDQDVTLIKGAQSLSNSLKTKIAGLEKGDQLSPDLRNQMATLMDSLYSTQVSALKKDPYISAKTKEAGLYGLTLDDTILTDITSINNSQAQQPVQGPQQITPEETQDIQFSEPTGTFGKIKNFFSGLF